MITAIDIPGCRAAPRAIDAVHSEVGYSVRHMLIRNLRGKFEQFDPTFVTGEDSFRSTVTVSAGAASVNANDETRDGHLCNNDFFDASNHSQLSFVSTGVCSGAGTSRSTATSQSRASRSL